MTLNFGTATESFYIVIRNLKMGDKDLEEGISKLLSGIGKLMGNIGDTIASCENTDKFKRSECVLEEQCIACSRQEHFVTNA